MSPPQCFALWVTRNGQHLRAGPFEGSKAARSYLDRLLDTSGGSAVTRGAIPMTPGEAREAAPLLEAMP